MIERACVDDSRATARIVQRNRASLDLRATIACRSCAAARAAVGRRVTEARVSATSPRADDLLLAALDDFALQVHLTQPTLGVIQRRGEDKNVVDALARFGANVESVSNHRESSFPAFVNPAYPL